MLFWVLKFGTAVDFVPLSYFFVLSFLDIKKRTLLMSETPCQQNVASLKAFLWSTIGTPYRLEHVIRTLPFSTSNLQVEQPIA